MKVFKKSHYLFIIVIIVACLLITSVVLLRVNENLPNEQQTNHNENEETYSTRSNDIKMGIELKNDILSELDGKNYNTSFGNEEYKVNISEEYINKWIERIAIDRVTFGNPEDILQSAINNALKHEATLILANENNIFIHDEELLGYIEEVKNDFIHIESAKELVDEVVDGLGLKNIDELFFEYDVDHHTKNYIWIQLRPKYEKENPYLENEVNYNQRILDLFHEDVNAIMKSLILLEN